MPPDQGFPQCAPDCSRYAQRLAQARPELFQAALAAIETPFDAGAMRAFLETQPAEDEAAVKRALRLLRQQVMLRVLLRDLSARAPLAEVVAGMSDLAEVSIDWSLQRLAPWLQAQIHCQSVFRCTTCATQRETSAADGNSPGCLSKTTSSISRTVRLPSQ